MELRIPIRKEFALLYSKGSRTRGFLPKGEGRIESAGGYWWIGTDDVGLCGPAACEEDADCAEAYVCDAEGVCVPAG